MAFPVNHCAILDKPLFDETSAELATGMESMKLWQTLRADAYRYSGKTGFASIVQTYLRYPGFRFTFYLRKVSFYSRISRSYGIFAYLYNRLWFAHYRIRYGFDVSPSTKIGPGFFIGHFGTVIISPYAVLGKNVNVAPGVVVGATSRGTRLGAPIIGDRVWLGCNSVVVGKITIGDDALIAPGAYVNFDVPPKAVVLGNPGKIVAETGSAGYMNRVLEEEE